MREIKFRGVDANGTMRYGRLSQDKPDTTIYYSEYSQRICWDNSNIPVTNKSLGQFTGIKDKNGKEIYEGDILKGLSSPNGELRKGKVEFKENGWTIFIAGNNRTLYKNAMKFEVIGNIYENPEPLTTKHI